MNTFNDRNSEFIKFVSDIFNKIEVTMKISILSLYIYFIINILHFSQYKMLLHHYIALYKIKNIF